jgi:hypothetical protein
MEKKPLSVEDRLKRAEIGGLVIGAVLLILIIWLIAAARGKAGMGHLTPDWSSSSGSSSSSSSSSGSRIANGAYADSNSSRQEAYTRAVGEAQRQLQNEANNRPAVNLTPVVVDKRAA